MSEWDAFPAVGAAPVPALPAAAPRPVSSPRPITSRYSGPMPTSADEVFASLIAQESGGRAGVRGPDTKYGNALGRTQVLPDTARGIAKNLGIPYREDLLTGTSPEAAAYQDQLGRAYLEEGFQNTGNARDALMYYHGGPDRSLWGPKTNAYADEVLSRWSQGGGVAPVDASAPFVNGKETGWDAFPEADPGAPEVPAATAKPGATPATAIDLSTARYQDEIDALKKGAWVREKGSDKPYQLEADAFPDAMRPIDRPQGGNIAVRPPNLEDRIGAVATAASEQIPFLDESVAFTTGLATGQDYGALREAQALNAQRLNQTERGARNVGGVVGAATGLALPGAGFIGRGGNLAARSLRASGVGAGYGALYGAGAAEGGLEERAQGAGSGLVAGGVLGGATPAIGQVASAGSNFVTRPAGRVANWLTGGRVEALQRFSPEAQANTRISEALRNDGVTQDALRAAIDEIQATGVNPSMIAVIQKVAPYGEAARLIRGSAMQAGPASIAAENFLERTATGLRSNAQNMTRALEPNAPQLSQVRGSITERIQNALDLPEVAPGTGCQAVSSALNQARDTAKRGVDAAYDAARQMEPGRAMISGSEVQRVQSNILDAVTDFDMRDVPRVGRVLEEIGNKTSPSVRSLFEARSRLTNLRISNDPVEASAAARSVRALDNEIDRLVTENAITGDVAAVDAWRAANAARRQFGQVYEGGDLVERLTSRQYRGGGMSNTVAPEDASNVLFGSASGVSPRANASRDLSRIREMVGDDTFASLQGEAATRLTAPRAGTESVDQLINRLRGQNPELANVLISRQTDEAVRAAQQRIGAAVEDRNTVDLASRIMKAGPDEFSAIQQGPLARGATVQTIDEAVGGGGEGVVRELAGGDLNVNANLRTVFGDQAAQYQEGMKNLLGELKAARFVASSTGSQSTPRLADSVLTGLMSLPTSVKAGMVSLIEKAARGATLTRAERQAIVELGVSEADLRRIADIPFISQYLVAPTSAGAGQNLAPR